MSSRRSFLAAVCAAGVICALPATAPMAQSQASPEQLISELGNELIAMLKIEGRAERETRFRGLLLKGVDVDLLAGFAIGRFRNELTADQRSEYRKLFEDFLVATYVSRLGLFSGEAFSIKTTQKLNDTEFLVQTLVTKPESKPIRLDWRVRGMPGRYRIIGVMVEGISMAVTQREEFAAVIQNGGGHVGVLLQRLRERAAGS